MNFKYIFFVILLTSISLFQTGCFQMQALQQENDRLKVLIGEIETQNEKYKTDFYTLLEQKKRQETEYKKEKHRLERDIEKQKNLRSEREKLLETRNQELTLLLQKERDAKVKTENDLNKEIDQLNKSIADGEKTIQETRTKLSQLLENIKNKDDEIADLKKKLEDAGVQLKQTNLQKDEVQKKYNNIQAGASVQKKEVSELKKEIAALKETIEDKNEDITSKDQKIADLNNQKKNLEAQLDKQKALEDEIQRRLKKLKENGEKLSAEDLQKQKDEIEVLKKDLLKLKNREKLSAAELDPEMDKAITLLSESFSNEIKKGIFQVLRDERGAIVRIPGEHLFETGTVVLKKDIKPTLNILASALAQFHNHSIIVEGHTDNQPVINMPFPDNLALAAQRSVNVARFLTANNLPKEAVRASAFGETKPIATNKNPEGRRQNRRVEIVLEPLVK